MVLADAPPRLLPLSLVELVRHLGELARDNAQFERAATLASQLEAELARLSGEVPAMPTRRRRRPTRTPRVAARLREAFQAECAALDTTVQRVQQQGVTISAHQLADLRLGERTRRIFHEAGLNLVQDVTALSPAAALDVPQLAPTNLSELRAAIMFALEMEGKRAGRQPLMLPSPRENSDLFEGLVQGVNQLPPRERETVVLRTGVGDRPHNVEEVAQAIDCPVDQVPMLERHALNLLLAQPASVQACWRLEELCSRLGLGWDDERLTTVVASLYPNTRASYTQLVLWLMREKGELVAQAGGQSFTEPHGVAHFDEMVVAAIGRYGELQGDHLTEHVRAALTPNDRAVYPDIAVSERVEVLGPAVQDEQGTFRLPDAPIPGVEDRHIRALNGLIGALQKLGTARISALTSEVNRRLPRQYQVNEHYVRAWLTRHPELFVQADADRFTLASLDVDILCGLANSWSPTETAPTVAVGATRPGGIAMERVYERVSRDIADLLRRDGPQPIARIRSHLYGRFIGQASADAVIAANPQRFVRERNGVISLRDDAPPAEPAVATKPAPQRSFYWQRR